MTEDEVVGWHHQLNGHGFGWTPGVGDGQGGLACCGSWDHKESDTIGRLNLTELKNVFLFVYVIIQITTFNLYFFPVFMKIFVEPTKVKGIN